MSSVIPFAFNALELYVVTVNGKHWIRAKEVCRALEYNKKTAHVIRVHCSRKNYAQKYDLSKVSAVGTLLNWPSDSRKDDYYINEEGMYELVFSSQQQKAKAFRKYCCNEMFPHIKQQLKDKLVEEHHRRTTRLQQAVEERDNRIQAIEYENVGLQGEITAYQAQLQVSQNRIEDLVANRHVPRSGAIDTVLVVVEKNADEDTKEHKKAKKFDKYMLRCQKKQVDGRLSVLRAKYPNMVVLEPRCDDGNAIHVWKRFKQRVLTKEKYYRNHFRLPPDAEELFEDMFGILV